jgi:hypothetical protein
LPPTSVNRPVALEVFIQNVGAGEAFDIDFTQVEDFSFRMLTGHEPATSGGRAIIAELYFNERAIIKNGIERLAPQQKKRLARIVLKDNEGVIRQRLISKVRSVSLTYKKHSRKEKISDSFNLDFSYYFELVDLLLHERPEMKLFKQLPALFVLTPQTTHHPNISHIHYTRAQEADACRIANQLQKRLNENVVLI